MHARIRYSLKADDGAVDFEYSRDEIEPETFELKLARWLCHHLPSTARARLAALDYVLFTQPGIDCVTEQATKYGIDDHAIRVALQSMPHIPAIHVGWRAGYHSGFTKGLNVRGMVRVDDRRQRSKEMLQARVAGERRPDAAA